LDTYALVRSSRALWRAFALQPPVLAFVTLWGSEAATSVPAALPLVLLVTVVLAAVGTVLGLDRTATTTSPEDHAATLRTTRNRQLVQQAVAVVPAWLGMALAFTVGPAWLFAGPDPDHVVDVTDTADRKIAALRCHVTQLQDADLTEARIRKALRTKAREAGLPDGRLGERFRVIATA
jgi:hypothetical protein